MRRWNVRPMETKRGVRQPLEATQPQELQELQLLQPFQAPQVQGQFPQTLQVVSPATLPQEPKLQLLQRLQPQVQSPATRPQGAQGLQAGVPSLATQPLQWLQPQPVVVPRTLPQVLQLLFQRLPQPQLLQEPQGLTRPQERELQLQLLI